MREKIIDATVEEFKQNGLKFTMNDLAKRLGISKKTIYTVFESKQAVLVAVADRYAADLYSMQEELEADVSLNVVQKLEKLCCKTDAEMLSRYVFIVNRPKTENETVYYNVDYIHTAIYENKQIKFHYAEWTVKKELKFKKNGAFYVVSPWALTWDDENYYLVAYDAAAGIIKHYRVDKMRDAEILEADRKGEESFKNFDLAAFAKKTFGMFGGVDAEVTLECRNELAGVVIDRFGHDVWMCPHGEDHFRARVPVAVSSQFFGWITGIGSGMRIVGPEDVRQQYKEYLQNAIQNYMD